MQKTNDNPRMKKFDFKILTKSWACTKSHSVNESEIPSTYVVKTIKHYAVFIMIQKRYTRPMGSHYINSYNIALYPGLCLKDSEKNMPSDSLYREGLVMKPFQEQTSHRIWIAGQEGVGEKE